MQTITDTQKEFEEFKSIFNFQYEKPLKAWINEESYNNLFKQDWNELMEVIQKIEQLPNVYDFEEFLLIRDDLITGKIEQTYKSVIDFIEYYNENKEDF